MTVASAVIVFASLLYVAGGVKDTLEDSSARIAAVSIGQRTVMAVDAMFRDSCGFECSTTVVLPNRIDSLGRQLDYKVYFSGSQVVVDYGYGKAAVESGRPLDAVLMEQHPNSAGKVLVIRSM
ncbi:Uncharacterised protein [Candidatus Burarchaeum australiense]|nr:Uncharacterised protein [Candidatus Burarchaeum australiense]